MSEPCQLCYGDGWISDQRFDFERCIDGVERDRFLVRRGTLSGVLADRIVCPRCQPNWMPPPPPPPAPPGPRIVSTLGEKIFLDLGVGLIWLLTGFILGWVVRG